MKKSDINKKSFKKSIKKIIENKIKCILLKGVK